MKKLLILFSLCSCYFLQAQNLTPAQAQAFKAQVQAKNQSIQTMQTDFLQRKHSDFITKDIESFGKMAFAKPAKLNWQYTKPYQYRIVFLKDHITISDAGKVSQIKADNKVFKKISSLVVGTITGDMFNDKTFTISYTKTDKNTLVKLLPNDKKLLKYIGEIELYFGADYIVERVKLIQPSKDYTEILFSNKKLNANIDETNFTM